MIKEIRLTIFVIVVVSFFAFQATRFIYKERLDNAKELVEHYKAKSSNVIEKKEEQSLGGKVPVANWYFLGHDLMFMAYQLQRQDENGKYTLSPRQLRDFFFATTDQLRGVGLQKTEYEKKLRDLINDADKIPENGWTKSVRDNFSYRLGALSDQIGEYAKKQQPNYKSPGNVF